MNLNEFYKEYDNLSTIRQFGGIETLFTEILRDHTRYGDLIKDILSAAEDYEADDYFGTEGMNV